MLEGYFKKPAMLLLVFVLAVSMPVTGHVNTIIEFLQTMAVLNTAATKCSDFTKEQKAAIVQNIESSISLLHSLGQDAVVDRAQIYSMVDRIYNYCAGHPDHLLLNSLSLLFPGTRPEDTAAFNSQRRRSSGSVTGDGGGVSQPFQSPEYKNRIGGGLTNENVKRSPSVTIIE